MVEDLNTGNKRESSRVQAVITWFGGFDLGDMEPGPILEDTVVLS